jgi:hypothetical protein
MSAAGPRIDVELVRQERHQLHIDASRRSARAGPGSAKFPELAGVSRDIRRPQRPDGSVDVPEQQATAE